MRTTINIHDDLLRQAKEAAARRQCTLGAVVEDALRKCLVQEQRDTGVRPTRLPTSGGNGLQPGVDLDSTADLIDIMEAR